MKHTKKILALALSIAVVASIAAAGTLAYLTSTTSVVENTFTVGDIEIDLKEHKLQEDGSLGAAEVEKNTYNRILPGQIVNKDPFVTVKAGSEDCFLYVCVDNKLNAIGLSADTNAKGIKASTTDLDTNAWVAISDPTADKVVYRYGDTSVKYSDEDQVFSVFNHVIFDDELTSADMEEIQNLEGDVNCTIQIQAFAHQATNLNRADVDQTACDEFGVQLLNAGVNPDDIF